MAPSDWQESDFDNLTFLAKGSMCLVFKAREKRSRKTVALKVLFKKDILSKGLYEVLRREVQLHSKLDHPNICKLFGYFHTRTKVFLVLQHQPRTLFTALYHDKCSFPQEKVAAIMTQLARALVYLGKASVIHRDIKLENILLDKDQRVKLCDFGSANWDTGPRTTFCGTAEYLAPQLQSHEQYGKTVDVWCLGVVMHELLFKSTPEAGCEPDTRGLSQPAEDLLRRLLERNPVKRITAEQILQHNFLK